MDSIFYPGLFSEAEKTLVKQSVLWPICQVLHYNSGLNLFIESYTPGIRFCNKQGLNILWLSQNTDNEINIRKAKHALQHTISDKTLLDSKNMKYLLTKLKSGSPVMQDINESIQNLQKRFPLEMSVNLQNRLKSKLPYVPSILVEFDRYGDTCEKILDHVYSNKTIKDLEQEDSNLWAILEDEHNKLIKNRAIRQENRTKLSDMFVGEKYVIINKMGGRLITGCITHEYVEQELVVKSHGLRLIKSSADLDADIMGRLAFWKMVREGQKITVNTDDPTQMFIKPQEQLIDMDANCMCVNNGGIFVYLLSKVI